MTKARELGTAEAQLERILYILPAACRPGGTTFRELADALGVSEDTVKRDIEDIAAREYYHPAGSIDAFGVFWEGDRVTVQAKKEYQRPVRLSAAEGLAVELGLRVLALEAEPARRRKIAAFGRRIRNEMVAPDTLPGAETSAPVHDDSDDPGVFLSIGDDALRGMISDAIADERVCVMSYLKAGDTTPADRRIAPQKLVYYDGLWYTLAYDYERKGTRFFRLDRMLDVEIQPESAEVLRTLEWDAGDISMPFAADEDERVDVRYAPGIARWITERTGKQPEKDGSVIITHRVADPRWLVRHVLQYAGDATVEDENYRDKIRAAAERLTAT
jgi:proteasome accessory factor C